MNWKCSQCQQIFEISSESSIRFCPNCGERINFEESTSHANEVQPEKNICPVCSTEIQASDEKIICPDCKIAFHKDCWNENNGCATYGCKSAGCLNPPPMRIDIQEDDSNSNEPVNAPFSYVQNQTTGGIECPYCHTKLALEAQICWACGKEISETINISNAEAPGPWTRWTARQIDCLIESIIIGYIFSILGIFGANTNSTIIGIVVAPFAFLLDSAVYAIFGNTLGKWLMGVMVVRDNGIRINGSEYFMRNMRVYWGGFGLGIPIVTLCTTITQYNRINKKQETTYDDILHMKSIRHNSNAIKSFFGVVLVIAILFGLVALSAASQA